MAEEEGQGVYLLAAGRPNRTGVGRSQREGGGVYVETADETRTGFPLLFSQQHHCCPQPLLCSAHFTEL